MKRRPKLTKRERQAATAEESRTRLIKVVERLMADPNRVIVGNVTSFEEATICLLDMYADATAEETMDAAVAMLEIAQQDASLAIPQVVESLVGICADEARRDAAHAELASRHPHTAHRLRLLFTHLPTNPTILARSAEFDASMARLASEIQ